MKWFGRDKDKPAQAKLLADCPAYIAPHVGNDMADAEMSDTDHSLTHSLTHSVAYSGSIWPPILEQSYVQWHMLDAWRPLLFSDEDQQAKATRDPVAPATRSAAALEKVHTHTLEDGSEAHSFRTLMKSLGTVTHNTCCIKSAAETSTFEVFTTPNAKQQHAFDLLKNISL